MKQYFALFFLFCNALFADGTINEITAQEGQNYNYWKEFANMLITLSFVLILIFCTVWILKKIMRSRIRTMNRSNGIKILERRPLNPKSSLYLIEVLGKAVVISESQAGIQVVTEFSDTAKADELLEQLRKEQEVNLSFKETFAKKLKKRIIGTP